MQHPDTQAFRLALESVREDLVAAVQAWRDGGGKDEELALVVDGLRHGKPSVTTTTREHLQRTIPDFDPTIVIELAKHPPGQAPAVVDLHDYVRRVVWIDLTPPFTW
jgi:hypothetical protein